MTQALTERYAERIAGVLSCYDRLVITGTLPTVCYAEGMTRTPADVPDAVFAEIQALFSTEQIVELTAAIALENFRARFNCALKIESDSLCMLPPDHPVRKLRE